MNVKIKISTLVARPAADGQVDVYGATETSKTVRIGTFADASFAARFLEASKGWDFLEIPEEKIR
jgi:hypothetical protein